MSEQIKQTNKAMWWLGGALGLIIIVGVIVVALSSSPEQAGQSVEVQPSASAEATADKRSGRMFLSLSDEAESYAVGAEVIVGVWLDTQGSNVNLAQVIVDYDSDLLELSEIQDDESVMTFQARDDSVTGRLDLLRGQPGDADPDDSDDGFTGVGLFTELVFEAQATGRTTLDLGSDSKMLLDDGRGSLMEVEVAGGVTVTIE